MKPHLRRPVWTKMFCPLRSYVGLNMHTVSCHSPFVVMDTDKGWVGVGAGGWGWKKEKKTSSVSIATESSLVLPKMVQTKVFLETWDVCTQLAVADANQTDLTQLTPGYGKISLWWKKKKKKRYTTQNTLQNPSTVGYSHQPFAQYGGEDSQLQFPVSGVWEKIGLPPLKTEQGFLGKPLIPFRNLSQLL